MKPAKFAISTAIYALTLAWIFTYLDTWPRLKRVVGWTTAIILVAEVALIDLQAARGVTSHFNVATPLDAVMFVLDGRRHSRRLGGRDCAHGRSVQSSALPTMPWAGPFAWVCSSRCWGRRRAA